MSEEDWVLRDQRTEKRFFTDNLFVDIYGPIVGPYGHAVYNVLLRHSTPKGTGAWPGHKKIAYKAGCGITKVKEVLVHMAKLRLIRIFHRYREDGSQTSNGYDILNPPRIPISISSDQEPSDNTPQSQGNLPPSRVAAPPQSCGGGDPSRVAATNNPPFNNPPLSIPNPSDSGLQKLVIDLEHLVNEESNAGYKREDYTYRCDECGEEVTQEQDICSGCGRPVVWKNSRTWKKAHGNWQDHMRDPYTADGDAFLHLFMKANEQTPHAWTEFASARQLKEWNRLIKEIGPAAAIEWIDRIFSYGKRGIVLVKIVMNSLRKYGEAPLKEGEVPTVKFGKQQQGEGYRFNPDAQDLGESDF